MSNAVLQKSPLQANLSVSTGRVPGGLGRFPILAAALASLCLLVPPAALHGAEKDDPQLHDEHTAEHVLPFGRQAAGPSVLVLWKERQLQEGDDHFARVSEESYIAAFPTPDELRAEIRHQRTRGLDLVRFDARVDEQGEYFVGVFEERRRSTYWTFQPMVWEAVERRFDLLAGMGFELLDLVIFQHRDEQRVATLWQPPIWPANGAMPAPWPFRLLHGASWDELASRHDQLRDRWTLTAFEGYADPAGSDEPRFAAVWRRGASLDSLLVGDLSCEGSYRVHGKYPKDRRLWAHCELVETVRDMATTGLRPVDIEPFLDDGELRFAVLFKAGSGHAWLQVNRGLDDAAERDAWLRGRRLHWGDRLTPFRGRLAELCLLPGRPHQQRMTLAAMAKLKGGPSGGKEPSLDTEHFHLGLAHDAGTSGPPNDSDPTEPPPGE